MEDLRKSLPSYKSDSSLIKTSEGVGVQGRSLVESRIGAMRSDIEKDSCENFTLRLEADIRMSDNQLPELVLAKSSSLGF